MVSMSSQQSPWMSIEELFQQMGKPLPEQIPASFDPSLTPPPKPKAQAPMPEPLPDQGFGFNGAGGSSSYSETTMNPEAMGMWRKLINKQSQGLEAERAGLSALEDRKKKIEEMPYEMDLSGLMALADSWGGGRFGSTYKKPDSPADRQKLMFEIEGQLQKAKQGFTDNELDLLKSQLEAAQMKESRAQAASDKRQQQLDRLRTTIVDDYNHDHIVKKYAQAQEQAGQVVDLLNSDNPLADNSIPTFMARASGEVGALTEADKAPFGGSKALKERIQQTMEQIKSGRLTPENAEFVRKLAGTMSKYSQDVQDKRARYLSEQYGRANSQVQAKDVLGVIAPHLTYEQQMKGERFKTSAEQSMNKPKFKAGDVRVKDGVTYIRNENGEWEAQ